MVKDISNIKNVKYRFSFSFNMRLDYKLCIFQLFKFRQILDRFINFSITNSFNNIIIISLQCFYGQYLRLFRYF